MDVKREGKMEGGREGWNHGGYLKKHGVGESRKREIEI